MFKDLLSETKPSDFIAEDEIVMMLSYEKNTAKCPPKGNYKFKRNSYTVF